MKVVNRQALFDYELGERIEAGMVLTGAEAKSAHKGAVDMGNAFVKVRPGERAGREAWVIGLKIYPYQHADNTSYDPERTRKLLLHQREIVALEAKMKATSRTLVPTAMYTKSGRIKIELALARGKRKYEKREKIKKRDLERQMG